METNAHNPFVRALETGGPWVADLLCALDSNSRTALAQSSKAGLSALLQEWTENASLTVWVKGSAARAEEPASKLAARMRTASMQLLTRGRLPTEVSIAQLKGHEFSEGDAWWVDTLPELAWEGECCEERTKQRIPSPCGWLVGAPFAALLGPGILASLAVAALSMNQTSLSQSPWKPWSALAALCLPFCVHPLQGTTSTCSLRTSPGGS